MFDICELKRPTAAVSSKVKALPECCICVCFSDFSNVISKSEIKALAEADEQEVVAEVQVSLRSRFQESTTSAAQTDRNLTALFCPAHLS